MKFVLAQFGNREMIDLDLAELFWKFSQDLHYFILR